VRALVQLTALGLLIKIVALLSFIGISKTVLAVPGKDIILGAFVIAMILYLIVATERLSGWQLATLAVFLTAGFVGIHHLLGFTVFRGLLKGETPFSLHHVELMWDEARFLLAGYLVSIFMILSIKRILRR
jgi:hypothetical protein